ncbi:MULTISPECIES: NrfD/PsrC family molybdoenzyme membrane anchor subunit [unclassified Campylobacter]|uniref:NrfD/PsrC family molybdoenzyme membrane anchor subunit n=1 Tax=unclassified Campylobacter TaxID=2593542 RepID=UPI0014755023|nr:MULTISPECIES: NrfD/PsrC family molybdoenzyme membrane anchor subunit [unclassified Campylobacter]
MNNMWGSVAQYNEIYWPWPIAVYLFLAGLSAGSMMVALLVKWNYHKQENDTIWDAMVKAGAIVAPITICVGLALLVFDLGKPLSFYWILLKYNFLSVMSIGVALLLIYTPFAFLFAIIIFEKEIEKHSILSILRPVSRIIRSFAPLAKTIETVLFLLAIGVGVYTGFLLSAITKLPLWNTPILPILFLTSGFSSGVAANILVGLLCFKHLINKDNVKYLLVLDLRAVLFEVPLIAILFLGLHFEGGVSAVAAKQALTTGHYAIIFWLGVVGVGLATPILIAATALKNHAYRVGYIVANSIVVIFGVILLRYYIVYAGQVFTGV